MLIVLAYPLEFLQMIGSLLLSELSENESIYEFICFCFLSARNNVSEVTIYLLISLPLTSEAINLILCEQYKRLF